MPPPPSLDGLPDPLSQMAFRPGFSDFVNTLLVLLGFILAVSVGVAVGVPLCRAWSSLNDAGTREDDVELLFGAEAGPEDEGNGRLKDKKVRDEMEDEEDVLPIFVYELAGDIGDEYLMTGRRKSREAKREDEVEILSSLVYSTLR